MFYTLQLTLSKKENGKYTKAYKNLSKVLTSAIAELLETDPTTPLKGLHFVMNADVDYLYVFFISPSIDYLQDVEEFVKSVLQTTQLQYGEKAEFKFCIKEII